MSLTINEKIVAAKNVAELKTALKGSGFKVKKSQWTKDNVHSYKPDGSEFYTGHFEIAKRRLWEVV